MINRSTRQIVESAMVYTPEGLTDNITISSGKNVPAKQHSVRKLLRQFFNFFKETLDIKPKISLRRLFALNSKSKKIRAGSMYFSIIPKRCSHTKINEWVKNIFTDRL